MVMSKSEFKQIRAQQVIPETVKKVEEIIDYELKRLAAMPEKDENGRHNTRDWLYIPEKRTSHENKRGSLTELGRIMENTDLDLRSIVRSEVEKLYSEWDLKWKSEDIGFEVRAYCIRATL